jgi:hypothetical protein
MDGVLVRAPFERFPASVKGAFVMRSEDPDPHQVKVLEARVVEVASRESIRMPIPPTTVDVAPNKDLFVPFEFPIIDLRAGWYGLQVDLYVDGRPHMEEPGKRFSVAWPRATMRRGSVRAGRSLSPAGGPEVSISTIDLGGDSLRITYSAERPVRVRVSADGAQLALLEEGFDEPSGMGSATAYPVPRTASALTVEVSSAARGGWSATEFELT